MPTLLGIQTRLWAAWGTKPDRIYYTNGGVGDELFMTAVAAAAQAAGRPIHVIATHPTLWRDNPDPLSIETNLQVWLYAQLRRWIPTEVVHLGYQNGNHRHIADQMAEHVGVKLPPDWRPVLRLGPAAARDPRMIVLQNSCRGARYAAETKEWAQPRWQELTRRLAGDYRLLQIGTAMDPRLDLAEDRRGQTDLRQAAALLREASLFVGLESGLQHVAAAVETPAVIIYGGRSRPDETGYAFNRNVVRSPACAGCGLNSGCPHEIMCMDIPVEEVEAAVRTMMAGHSSVKASAI